MCGNLIDSGTHTLGFPFASITHTSLHGLVKGLIQMKIMIVDNDPTYLGLLSEVLLLHGYEVVTAGDGEEALTKLRETLVDFIISDISMPKMNGITLHKYLRQDLRLKHIPFAWNSMYRELRDVVEIEDSAIDLTFSKTMTVHNLIRSLNDFAFQS